MAYEVKKSDLVEEIESLYFPVVDRQREEGTYVDLFHRDTVYVDMCRSIIDDIDWLFKYTEDRETWTHVDDLSTINPFSTFMSVDTVAEEGMSSFLYERAGGYFNQLEFRTKKLDWFFLDYIIAVCYRSLLRQYSDSDYSKAYPAISKAIKNFGGSNYWSLIKYVMFGAVKNIIWLWVVVFLFVVAADGNIWAGLFASALVAVKIYGWYSQARLYRKLKEKSSDKLSDFLNTYKLFADGIVRWDLLEHDIKRLRDKSIEFPLVIDSAVTSNRNLSKI